MDVTVKRAAKPPPSVRNAWDLTDLLGRPLGRITEERNRTFFIEPNARGHILMARADLGPHASLNAALTAIEKHAHGVCRYTSEEN